MSVERPASPKRSRFGNVANFRELPVRRWEHESGRYGADGHEVAPALGAEQLGYGVIALDPGKRSCPFHFHHLEEEVFFVLDGTGVLRQGTGDDTEEIELSRGDFVAFPAGTGIAHQFINRGDRPFVYVAMSNKVRGDVAEYPDSDKILFRSTRLMLRRTPPLGYFDGEV
jgi:uncharacterized cupin superfamily protein